LQGLDEFSWVVLGPAPRETIYPLPARAVKVGGHPRSTIVSPPVRRLFAALRRAVCSRIGAAMILIAGVGFLAVVAVPNFVKLGCRAKQSEAKTTLKSAFESQLKYYAEFGRFESVKTSTLSLKSGNRYTYCFSPEDCLPCDAKAHSSCAATLEASRAACAKHVLHSGVGDKEDNLTLCAAANLDNNTQDLDIWLKGRSNRLEHVSDDCN
jgi:Tfp pilus assembly protein PilE